MPELLSPKTITQIQNFTFSEGEVVEGVGNYENVNAAAYLLLQRFWQLKMQPTRKVKPPSVRLEGKRTISEQLRAQADTAHLIGQLHDYTLTSLPKDADEKIVEPRAFVSHKKYAPNNEKLNLLLTSSYYTNGELYTLIPTLLRLYTSWSEKEIFVSANLSPLSYALRKKAEDYYLTIKTRAYWKDVLALLTPVDMNVEQ